MKRPFALLLLVFALAGAAADGRSAPVAAQVPPLVVEFLDVGQGDSVLIRTPDGKVALIDTGTRAGVMKHLEKREIKKIDLLVTSHHHSDHMGGSTEVVEECQVVAYLDSGSAHTSKTYKTLLQAVKDSTYKDENGKEKPTKVLIPRAGVERKIKLGESVVIRVFPQPPEDEDNENNNSVGVRVEYKDFSVLLTGDSEEDERAWWRKNADKTLYSNVTVMKLAHHGSHNGTDKEWLAAAKPELAVASCGKDNSYGHPHKKTLDLLTAQNVTLKRTDEVGTVAIKTDGTTWALAQSVDGPKAARLIQGEPALANPRGWYTGGAVAPSRRASPAP